MPRFRPASTGPLALLDEVSLTLAVSIADEARAAAERAGQPYDEPAGEALKSQRLGHLRRIRPARQGRRRRLLQVPRRWQQEAPVAPPEHVRQPAQRRAYGRTRAADRMLYVQALETLRCLDRAGRARTCARCQYRLDLRDRLPWLDWRGRAVLTRVGVRAFAARAAELARQYGARFTPPALLREHAERGLPFRS